MQRNAAVRAGAGAGPRTRTGCAGAREHRAKQRGRGRQHDREAAQRAHVGATGRALVAMRARKAVALAGRVEDAERQAAHQGALLLTPVAVADARHEHADLAGDARPAGALALHQLAHARLADAHPRGRLRTRQAVQVAERRRLQLARAQARAQALEQLAQPRAIVELGGEVTRAPAGERDVCAARVRVGLGGVARHAELQAPARAMLVDRAAKGDDSQPARRVLDLLARQHRRVQSVPGGRVAGLQIDVVEGHAAGAQAPGHGGDDAGVQRRELLAQQALGAVAAQAQRTHRWIMDTGVRSQAAHVRRVSANCALCSTSLNAPPGAAPRSIVGPSWA